MRRRRVSRAWRVRPLAGSARKKRDAKRFAAAWREENPARPVPEYMEPFEVSEYGRAPTEEDLKLLLGASPIAAAGILA